ncbi:lysophospholipid acyltransferase family protein [Streptomyces sp. NPDC001928]|uniref:lysophospholipid acyltransferase family protein n=1 Tax=Streptomyces sp. NPDC001928 TaxID=3154404 RepID=UPI00332BC378
MFPFRRDRTPTQSTPAHSASKTVRSFLGSLAPLVLWALEQSDDILVLALTVAVVESAGRLREARLYDTVFRTHEAAYRRASAAMLRPVHTSASAARRALWWSTVTALGGLSVTGLAPVGPCVVVANHQSHADTPALLAALSARGRPRVAAAADHWFARRRRRYFCRWLVGGFPVRRTGGGREDLMTAARFLEGNGIVVVFPEGTRGTGADLGPFRTGAFDLARLAGVPVVPVAIVGTSAVLAKNARRFHRAPVRLEFGEPQYLARPDDTRNRIADMLRHHDTRQRPDDAM